MAAVSARHPARITVDLVSPAVDVDAPLDDRDIDLVQQTFARVAMLGANNVGKVVFMNIFKIAPEAQGLFPFRHDVNMYAPGGRLEVHATKVVTTLAVAIELLRDLGTLVPVLKELGLKHVGFGVLPEHYDVVGQAIINSLSATLGAKFTEPVKNAYLKVWTIVKNNVTDGNYNGQFR